jgi:hypothetical protein
MNDNVLYVQENARPKIEEGQGPQAGVAQGTEALSRQNPVRLVSSLYLFECRRPVAAPGLV